MKKMLNQLFPSLGLVLLMVACGPDTQIDQETQNDLQGRWVLHEAFRNGTPAASLEDLFFEFNEDGQMMTNILGSTTKTDYIFEGEQIVQTAGDNGIEVAYDIESMTDTSLVLTTTLRRYNFKFDLRRGTEAE